MLFQKESHGFSLSFIPVLQFRAARTCHIFCPFLQVQELRCLIPVFQKWFWKPWPIIKIVYTFLGRCSIGDLSLSSHTVGVIRMLVPDQVLKKSVTFFQAEMTHLLSRNVSGLLIPIHISNKDDLLKRSFCVVSQEYFNTYQKLHTLHKLPSCLCNVLPVCQIALGIFVL